MITKNMYYKAKRKRSAKALARDRFCLNIFSFKQFSLLFRVCLSGGAKRRHLYQDKHTRKCYFKIFLTFLINCYTNFGNI